MQKTLAPETRRKLGVVRSVVREQFVRDAPAEKLPEILVSLNNAETEVARLKAIVWQRLMTPAHQPAPDDVMLNVEDAAKLLALTVPQLKRRARTYPFTKKLGRKTTVYSQRGIERWLKQRRAS